jgi:phosphatidylethanolamine-binding protein (PEBP) family uncharacterized protein
MKSVYPIFIIAVLALSLGGCAKTSNQVEIPKDAVPMDVEFSWDGVKPCTHNSPPIHVSKIPAGTKSFRVSLSNLTEPAWNQGGGNVVNDGSGLIPADALNIGYNSPCPPADQRNNYEFSVFAVNGDGLIIGFGKQRHPFPPKK